MTQPKSDLFYGHSHKGKSKALCVLAEHLYNTTGRKTRLYSGDAGVETFYTSGLIDKGIVEVCHFGSMPQPLTILRGMSAHFWPNAHGKWESPSDDFIEGKTHALVIYEGATVIKHWLLSGVEGGIADKVAHGETLGVRLSGEKLVSVDKKESVPAGLKDFTTHGHPAGLHHMAAHSAVRDAIRRSQGFKGMVIWTAHPTEAPDTTEGGTTGDHGKIQGKRIVGPDITSKAAAATITRDFANTLHFDTAMPQNARSKDSVTGQSIAVLEPEFRIYTRSHYDPDGKDMTEYRAGTRAEGVNLYYTSTKPGDGIINYYQDVGTLDPQTTD